MVEQDKSQNLPVEPAADENLQVEEIQVEESDLEEVEDESRQIDWRRFAPFGLYLSLAALLAAIGFYVVQSEFNLPVQISLGLVVLGLALFTFLDPDRVRVLLTGRQARYGSNALILTIAFVGIVVVINYLVYNNSKRWDLTEDKQNTLAAETLQTLDSLSEPVIAEAYFTARSSPDRARDLLDQYKFYGKDKFDYVFIDPEADPVRAEQAKVTRDGTIILRMGQRQEPVTFVTEQELTGSLVRLMSTESRTVYFLTGHGEKSPEDAGETSYALVKRTLESKNYTVKMLNLLAENQIPADAKVVVVAGPRKPLSQQEVDQFSLYLAGGGSLVVLLEPTVVTEFGDAPDPLALYLEQTWGFSYGDNLVIDQSSNQPSFAIGSQWGNHQITTQLKGYVTVMPTTRSVSLQSAPTGVSQVQLLSTSAQSWAETDLEAVKAGSTQIKPDQGVDLMGPVPIAALGENFEQGGRVVAIGDADFATDGFFIAYGNGDFFVNSVDWAAGQEQLINLTPKNTTQRLLLPPQKATMNLIFLGTVCLMPGLILLAGVFVWWQRRRRG